MTSLSKKDVICARLARLVGRAYYDDITVMVLDAVIYLDQRNQKRVLEKEVSDRLHLGIKQVREILQRLRKDQMIASSHVREEKEEDEFAPTPSRRQRAFIRATAQSYYYMSYEHLCKLIKVKHSTMMRRMEAKQDKSEQFYVCPNKTVCPIGKAGTKFSVMDLLFGLHLTTDTSEAQVAAAAGRTQAAAVSAGVGKTTDFACPKCKTMRNGVKGPTILVLTAESQQQLGSAGSNLISRFNSQLKDIMTTLASAEQEIKQAKKDEEEQKTDEAYKSAMGIPVNKPTQPIVKQEIKPNINHMNISVSTGTLNHTITTPTIKLESKPIKQEHVKLETRHLPSTANVTVNTTQGEFKAIPQLHRKPLPWMKNESLLALEEQKKMAELHEQKRAEAERRKQEEEKRKFDSIYAHEMSRMSRMEISLPPTYDVKRSQLLYPDIDDSMLPMITVAGQPVRCSQLTQSHLDHMTDDEFQMYTSLFCSSTDMDDPDGTDPSEI